VILDIPREECKRLLDAYRLNLVLPADTVYHKLDDLMETYLDWLRKEETAIIMNAILRK
jgi:hypothetical protein